ncbi:type VI secretion system secreted protein VgrG [Undibacterium sp. GrIS 1.2]|uniref:type VI secretion system Vgr family protein n=1 Tax=Undibacterium sp. GrIS 1.2 TaxID=3143933 RepID=UPI003398B08B
MRNQLETALNSIFSARQTNRLLRLSFPKNDAPKALMVANRLDAVEAVSRDFKFTVEVISNDAHIALKDVQNKLVSIALTREDGSLRYFSGYVFEFRLVKADGGQVYYDMVLMPWLAHLRMRRDNFLFHDKTLLDQTEDIFGDYPVRDSELRITHDVAFTDAVQFDESDYNYLHRRWEQQGWHYWYEHRADGHTLILSDDSTQAAPIDGYKAEIPFQRAAGSQEDDAIGDWTPVRHIVPSSVTLSSFDFKSPRPINVNIRTNNYQGDVLDLEVYEYSGAYGFKDRNDGDAQSRLRMEEIEASGKHFEGSGNDRTAQPGRWFRLTKHFDTEVFGSNKNADTFLILEVRHSASNNYQMDSSIPAHYSNHLSCIRKIIPYRPARGYNSIEPKIYGIQTALVTGSAGEEIHTDEYGRVRVQFHWDREGSYNEKSSAWVRVATAWSGSNFGMTSIPRVGTEVIVQFLDGNPDRPLITGMVPNAANKPAWDLPANKTQSGILSRSTPNGSYSNANALRFEDKMGQEQLWLHAEKDQLTEVEHDEDKWVGNDRRKTIDRDETNHIKRDRTETVDRDETITVHNNRTERVDHNEQISIGDNRTEDVGKNETISIGGNRTKSVAKHEKDSIGKNWSINVGKMKTETIGMAYMQNVGLGRMENVGMGYSLNVGLIMSTVVGMNQISKVGTNKTVDVGEEYTIKVGKKFTIEVGGTILVMNADGSIAITGKTINITAQGANTIINGEKVLMNPAGVGAAVQPSGGDAAKDTKE